MELDEAVRRALALIPEHPEVRDVGEPEAVEESGAVRVEVTFNVNLPNEWRADGESPSGVRLREAVRMDFPNGYPMAPPELSLRTDFTRDLPHMQPWTVDGRPVPCIYDGILVELLHQAGLAAILNQTAVWLDRAALGKLIDPEQGWEPVRRDVYGDLVVADAEQLRGWVDNRGGYRFVETHYLRVTGGGTGTDSVQCQVSGGALPVKRGEIAKTFRERALDGEQLRVGQSLAIVVWPGKESSGKEIVCDTYLPEAVEDVASLRERASLYGCRKELNEGLGWLRTCLGGLPSSRAVPLMVILLARRPIRLIGSESPIELCPYVVDIVAPELFADGAATQVRPAAHRAAVTPGLLARMAGKRDDKRLDWTLVGAGSMGSKLALHLARSGAGPTVVVDKSIMAPHNAARHALIPEVGDLQVLWTDDKASKLTYALAGLDQTAKPVRADAARLLQPRGGSTSAWSRRTWAVVNTTASLALRESFGAVDTLRARVVETTLFGAGRVGVITVEGPDRNPNTVDLMAEVYAMMLEDPSVRPIVFGGEDSIARQSTGQGCGSMTMTMSDGRLSLFAAGAAEYLLGKQGGGLPKEGGEIVIGRLSHDRLGVAWESRTIKAPTEVSAGNAKGWRVRIHDRALTKMQREAARWPNDETGGVLMGRLSEASRVVSVVDVLDAPEDSQRSPGAFVLGTRGLRRGIDEYARSVDWSLYCLGTWHSHLGDGGPSPRDHATATAVALARLTPTVFLVLTPMRFHALTMGT